MRRAPALLLLLIAVGCGGSDTVRGDLAVRADRVFDGRRMIGAGVVVIRGDEIVAVGDDFDVEAERTITLGDATVMPGFIDLHTHVTDALMLTGGVTTIRNVGWPLEGLHPPRRYGGLRVLMAGPLVTVPGGYPTPVWGPEIALNVFGPADARRAVRLLERRGAAVIKIALEPRVGPMLSVAEVRAIVDEAHAHGLEVTAHAETVGAAIRAIEGGVDELAHMPCDAVSDAVLRRLVESEIEVVGTLHVESGSLGCGDIAEDARRFVRLGGELLYGSDVGNPGIPFGIDVKELRLLREAGLSPEEVRAAGTSRAGKQLGLTPLGMLVEGAPADVIAARGDARELRDDLGKPLLVVAGGKVVHDRRPPATRP